ncbi:uncharacterized protein EDB91DRAFT_1348292 [Suillus paluster]|uniref:uncharacterized protein n=1 Tax=Suillus paluster TaxID=48578 RepID=UPI001B88086F|nr:uncharacterized protein EDB91DRAFT_1348292 [Suillus paluster]KAG1735631.1 hypothetical protein EDB91DRAFT_1348292 [Suillus paluster]
MAVVYDWVLSFEQELELVWRQRWSLMTVLYICVRYLGILYCVVDVLGNISVSITDAVSNLLYFTLIWMPVVVNTMLGVIMMTRIHAMYQQSRKMLIFLVVLLLASTIASGVMSVMEAIGASGVEAVLSGYHMCLSNIPDTEEINLSHEVFIPTTVWDMLALILAVWIVVKHVYELRQSSTRFTFADCFMVLIQSHVLYFVAVVTVSCLNLSLLSPYILYSASVGSDIDTFILHIAKVVQMFVLGPRLILSVREYYAKLVTRSDEGTGVTTIAFQERGQVSTGGDV